MKDNILTRLTLLLLIAAAMIGGAAVYSLRTISQAVAGSDWVNHTYAAIFQCEHLSARLQQADGLLRTYALSGDARDLAGSREAIASLDEIFENLTALTRDDAAARTTLAAVKATAAEREALAEAIWAARAANDAAKVRTLLAADAGSAAVAGMQRNLAKIRDAQFAQLSERDHVAYVQAQRTRWVVGIGIGLNFLLLGAVGWLLRDDLAARRRAATALAEANAQLEDKVRARTAELQATNDRLRAENLERQWTIASQTHQLRYNQLIVNSAQDLIFVLTLAQNVTRINAAVVQLTGRVDEEVLAKPLAQVVEVPKDAVTGLDPLHRALLEGRELRAHPATVLCRDGRRLPARLTMTPIRDEDKVVGGVLVVQVASSPANPATP